MASQLKESDNKKVEEAVHLLHSVSTAEGLSVPHCEPGTSRRAGVCDQGEELCGSEGSYGVG